MYGVRPDFLGENAINDELYRRWKKGERDIYRSARLITIKAGRSVEVSGQIDIFQPIEFSYPSIVFPITQLLAAPVTAQSGKLFAYLGERPSNPPSIGTYAIESQNGVLRIPCPGQWWVGYDSAVDTEVQCMAFDNTCGAAEDLMAARNVIIRERGVVAVLAAASTLIVPDDQYRDGVVIQNQGGSDVWVRLGGLVAAVGTGYVIPPGESLPLIGELAYKGPVHGRADTVNSNVFPWEVLS